MRLKCYLISALGSYSSIGVAGLVCTGGNEDEAWSMFFHAEEGKDAFSCTLKREDFKIDQVYIEEGSVIGCYDYYGPTLALKTDEEE